MITVILLVVALFSLLVLVHEWGHFIVARRNGIEVEEFGIGFPPRLLWRKVKGTIYSINLFPLGGFVRLKGEDSASRAPGSFGTASFKSKAKVLLAGVGMNLAVAYLILTALAFTGLPPIVPNQFSLGQFEYAQPKQVMVVDVGQGSPAAVAGIRRGEVILGASGQTFAAEDELINFTRQHAGEEVVLKIKSGEAERDAKVKLRGPGATDGYLGVTPFQTYKIRYGWQAPLVAAGIMVQLIWATVAAFGGLLAGLISRGEVSQQVTGPVGVAVILGSIMELGISYLAMFVASISLSLAVINALPLPALDGGRLALITVPKIIRRPLSPQLEARIHTAGFIFLIALMIIVTVVDIKRFG